MFKQNATILFQGDSITDCSRSRTNNSELGHGYAALIRDTLHTTLKRTDIRVLNRGISGNRAIDLLGRWEEDCVSLAPDYVSILIGVNDTWRRYDSNDPTSSADFTAHMRRVIALTQEKTGAEILLLGPFLLDIHNNITRMREDLIGKQEAIRLLAKETGTHYLDLDAMFRETCRDGNPADYAADGVHPTALGHARIAEAWLNVWPD